MQSQLSSGLTKRHCTIPEKCLAGGALSEIACPAPRNFTCAKKRLWSVVAKAGRIFFSRRHSRTLYRSGASQPIAELLIRDPRQYQARKPSTGTTSSKPPRLYDIPPRIRTANQLKPYLDRLWLSSSTQTNLQFSSQLVPPSLSASLSRQHSG